MDEIKKYLQAKKEELDTAFPPSQSWDHIRQALHPDTTKAGSQELPARPVQRLGLYKAWIAAAAVLLITLGSFYIANTYNAGPAQLAASDSSLLQALKDIRAALPRTLPSMEKVLQPGPVPVLKTMDTVLTVGYRPKTQPDKAEPVKKTVTADSSFSIEATYAAYVQEQLRQLRRQPVYIDDPEYFDFFKTQFASLEKEEQDIKKNIRKEGLTDTTLDALIRTYQQKAAILRDLQFEINRVNTRIRTQPGGSAREAGFINL